MSSGKFHDLARWLMDHRSELSEFEDPMVERAVFEEVLVKGVKPVARCRNLSPNTVRLYCNKHRIRLLEETIEGLLQDLEVSAHGG